MRPLLEGTVEPSLDDTELLRRKIARLEGEIADALAALVGEREKSTLAVAAMSELRRILAPLHRALALVFEELNSAGAAPGFDADSAGVDRRWNSWKQRLPGRPAEMIDALLEHREMSAAQLAALLHCDPRTVHRAAHELNKAQLISSSGGKYSLKTLP